MLSNVLKTAPVFIFFLLAAGCERKEQFVAIDLPPTPVLTRQSNWVVVSSSYVRVRKEPNTSAEAIAHLRHRSVAEIVTRTPFPEMLDGRSDYWYQVQAEGVRGWIFGSFIELHDSKAGAEQAARDG
jgi:hypothetical protein